jgi:hypothetical protein
MTWRDSLLKYGKLAYETGQTLSFRGIKRIGERKWRIELNRAVDHGEDKLVEDD